MYEFRIARIEAAGASDEETISDLMVDCPWIEFQPRAAPQSLTWTAGQPDGGWPVSRQIDNVEETLTLWTSRPMHVQKVLTGAFETARLWAMSFRRDMRVVAQIRNPDRNPHYYEAQIYDGSIEPDGASKRLIARWTREPFWRGEETTLQVRTWSTEAWGDAATIYNSDDSQPGHNNFVFLQPPAGNVPALTRIRISNNYASGRLAEVRIGWYDRQINLSLEGEDSELSPDITPDADYSNQAYGTDNRFRWTLDYSSARDFVGPFRVLVNGRLSGDRWRAKLGYELTALQTGRWITGANGWTDLGLFMMPPGGYTHPERYAIRIWLESEDDSDGVVDFVHFAPAQQFRRLKFKAYNSIPGTCIDDDGIRRETAYQLESARLPMIDGWGERIQVYPADLLPRATPGQMLTFNLTADLGAAEALRTAQIEVLAAPRWDVLPEA